MKDSKKFEKEEVGLLEKKKHLTTKQKKFKKSITDVIALSSSGNDIAEADRNRTVIPDLKLCRRSITMLLNWRRVGSRWLTSRRISKRNMPSWRRSEIVSKVRC